MPFAPQAVLPRLIALRLQLALLLRPANELPLTRAHATHVHETQEFKECLTGSSDAKACRDLHEDYMECLHHKKEVSAR